MTTYTPLEDNSARRSRKQCIGLTIGGVLFSALLISSLVLNVHYIIRNDANQRLLKKHNQLKSQTPDAPTTLKKVVKGAAACDGTQCPTGCCIGETNWFCCSDGQYCAATEDACPDATNIVDMASMKVTVKKGADACDGTDCPNGCCPGEYNWFCCTDGLHCAATEDNCPATDSFFKMLGMKAKAKKVVKGAAACDGTDCPAGCCTGEYNWFCCSDGQYCADKEEDCPATNIVNMASLKARAKKV